MEENPPIGSVYDVFNFHILYNLLIYGSVQTKRRKNCDKIIIAFKFYHDKYKGYMLCSSYTIIFFEKTSSWKCISTMYIQCMAIIAASIYGSMQAKRRKKLCLENIYICKYLLRNVYVHCIYVYSFNCIHGNGIMQTDS